MNADFNYMGSMICSFIFSFFFPPFYEMESISVNPISDFTLGNSHKNIYCCDICDVRAYLLLFFPGSSGYRFALKYYNKMEWNIMDK